MTQKQIDIACDVSVIIVSFNTAGLLRDCIRSVYEKTSGISFEIIVVDNYSTDGSVAMVKEEFPAVRLIENRENAGFGRANNAGMRAAAGNYFFLLNSDTLLVSNAIGVFFDYMEKPENAAVACCGGNLYNADMTPQISYGNFPSLKQVLFEQFWLEKLFRNYYARHLSTCVENRESGIREVAYVSGADMFLRRSALDETGLFDEEFFLYYEETELSFRIRSKGYRSAIIPEAAIVHLCGKSFSGTQNFRKLEIAERSKYLYFTKCHGAAVSLIARLLTISGYLLKMILHADRGYARFIRMAFKA